MMKCGMGMLTASHTERGSGLFIAVYNLGTHTVSPEFSCSFFPLVNPCMCLTCVKPGFDSQREYHHQNKQTNKVTHKNSDCVEARGREHGSLWGSPEGVGLA